VHANQSGHISFAIFQSERVLTLLRDEAERVRIHWGCCAHGSH